MVTYDRNTNLQSDPGFARVKFGAGQQLLETELNELQVLNDLKMGRLITAVVGNALIGSDIYADKDAGKLYVSGGFAFVGGRSAQIGDMSCELIPGSKIILQIHEREVTENDSLREHGNIDKSAPIVANSIMDLRYNVPMSHRTVWEYELRPVPDDGDINDLEISDIINSAKTGAMSGANYSVPSLTVAVVDPDYNVDIIASKGKSADSLSKRLDYLFTVLGVPYFEGIDSNRLADEVTTMQRRIDRLNDLLAVTDVYGVIELSASSDPMTGTKLHFRTKQEVLYA